MTAGPTRPRLQLHCSPAFPHLGRRRGWHGRAPAPAHPWAQNQGTDPGRATPALLPWRGKDPHKEQWRLQKRFGGKGRKDKEAIPGPLMHFKRKQSRLLIFSFPDPVFHFKSALTFWLSFLLISQVWSVRIHSSVWHRRVQRKITPGDEGAPQGLGATSMAQRPGGTGGHPAPCHLSDKDL